MDYIDWIKDTIHKLLEKHETNEPSELCDQLGIRVIYEFLGEQEILGYSIKSVKAKIIVVDDQLDYYDRRVVLAHELGHALLHPDLNSTVIDKNTFQSMNKLEIQANTFAADLLLPDGFEKDVDFIGKTNEQIAAMVAMPVELVELKFKNN